MNGLEHAKVSMVQHHRWASDVIQAIAVEPGMTFGWTDCGYVEVRILVLLRFLTML
jgi:hypothetical protein